MSLGPNTNSLLVVFGDGYVVDLESSPKGGSFFIIFL